MWIFTSTGFLSVVQDQAARGDALMVRGRFKGDVERFLNPPGLKLPKVVERMTPHADYRFRASVHRGRFEQCLLEQVERIDYPNFKDSIKATFRKTAAMRVWSTMNAAQLEQHGPRDSIGFPTNTSGPTHCGYCTFDEAEGELLEQCRRCKAVDALGSSQAGRAQGEIPWPRVRPRVALASAPVPLIESIEAVSKASSRRIPVIPKKKAPARARKAAR